MTDLQNFHAFPAPAKINLFLHVTGQRADGYHLLQTVFRLLDYGDTIHIKPTAERTIKRSQPVAGIPEQHDLCIRAANLLQRHTGCSMGAEIAVKKNIPMGGGLGGGSSDAATVLLALNRLWGLNLQRSELIELGLKLGADVPFFIYGSNAWAEGIGEKLQKILLKPAWYVVLTPSVHVSTAEIFANKELTKNTNPNIMSGFSGTPDLTTENVDFGNIKPEFINDLEKVVCKLYPEVKACLDWLKHHGDARMSGSGASIFLEVESQDKADSILRTKPENIFGFVAKGLDQHPLFEYAD